MQNRKERRRFPRSRSSFPMRYRLIPVGTEGYLHASVEDLSPDGVRFRCAGTMRPRTGLLLELQLPGAQAVRTFGRATWVRELPGRDGFEVGGRFVDQSTSTRRAIEQHIGG
jgi:hypothetical protein